MIGFTGTQKGMTPAQFAKVKQYLAKVESPWEVWFHHGDCIGADHDFHRLVRQAEGRVHLHPPDNDTKRAFCDFDRCDSPLPYLTRNRHIVMGRELLLAAPAECDEVLRSGTWSTIRYAKSQGVQRFVINPDGTPNTDWTQINDY